MSHPFCSAELVCPVYPMLGWEGWNGKALYIRTTIHDSVTHRQACGEAIHRWNEAVGERFLMVPDQGTVQISFQESNRDEWPFSQWPANGSPAWGLCLNYDVNGAVLGANPGQIARSEVYVNRNATAPGQWAWINVFAHEIGHAFGLADHSHEDLNSVMSYQVQGRWLFGPSREDEQGIAAIYGLPDLRVRPGDLEGIENIETIWWYDRYDSPHHWEVSPRRWRLWSRAHQPDLESLHPYETYWVTAKVNGTLGFGRFEHPVVGGQQNRWVYL